MVSYIESKDVPVRVAAHEFTCEILQSCYHVDKIVDLKRNSWAGRKCKGEVGSFADRLGDQGLVYEHQFRNGKCIGKRVGK